MNAQISILNANGKFSTRIESVKTSEVNFLMVNILLETFKKDKKAIVVVELEGNFTVCIADAKPIQTRNIIEVQSLVPMKFIYLHLLVGKQSSRFEDKKFETNLNTFEQIAFVAPEPKEKMPKTEATQTDIKANVLQEQKA